MHIDRFEIVTVQVSARTTWLHVLLHTNLGLVGVAEASLGSRRELPELGQFFALVKDRPLPDVETYRRRGRSMAAQGGLRAATAFSAIEHALWDLAGKAEGVPAHALLGERVRDDVLLYGNINRMTSERTPDGFAASAERAVAAGFRALKAAPFDGFPPRSDPDAVRAAIDLGIRCLESIRAAVGPDIALKVDCHSHFTEADAVRIAERLEPVGLDWYEEPVPAADAAATARIRQAVQQRLAGGEMSFGVEGFAPLLDERAVDVVMPDTMHCGGLAEGLAIARAAADAGIAVSPHNAAGPVSTAAALQLCAVAPGVESLELQWGEVPWRADLVEPPERFEDGRMAIPDTPGLGMRLLDPPA